MSEHRYTHGKYAIPGRGMVGREVVWRPFLLYEGNRCNKCGEVVKPKDKPAFWAGRDSGYHMAHWHGEHYDGPYIVNKRDQVAHDEWIKQRSNDD